MEAVGRGPGKVSGEARAVPTSPNFTLLTTALFAAITLAGCTAAETDALKPAAVSELPDPELPDEVGVVPAARPVAGAAGAAEAAQEAIGAVATAYAASRPAGAAAILAQAGSSAAIPAPDGRLGPQAVGARSAELDQLIARYAAHYGVPESLVRRVVKRESTFNPAARNGPYWGLMQILPATARTMGYTGPKEGLLDAETNLKYGVRYLRGAWLTAGGNEDLAVRYYARGYYYDAKAKGLLEETGLGRDRHRMR